MPSSIRDPLDVLEGILGVQVKPSIEVDIGSHEAGEVPNLDEVEDIDFGGLSLEAFVEREERREMEDRELQVRARNHSVNTLVDCEFPWELIFRILLTWSCRREGTGQVCGLTQVNKSVFDAYTMIPEFSLIISLGL